MVPKQALPELHFPEASNVYVRPLSGPGYMPGPIRQQARQQRTALTERQQQVKISVGLCSLFGRP